MANSLLKKLIPTFVPLALEIMHNLKRDASHNSNIKKIDQTDERLSTIENLIVKLEKKTITNRDELKAALTRIQVWLAFNSLILVAIAIKLFFVN